MSRLRPYSREAFNKYIGIFFPTTVALLVSIGGGQKINIHYNLTVDDSTNLMGI